MKFLYVYIVDNAQITICRVNTSNTGYFLETRILKIHSSNYFEIRSVLSPTVILLCNTPPDITLSHCNLALPDQSLHTLPRPYTLSPLLTTLALSISVESTPLHELDHALFIFVLTGTLYSKDITSICLLQFIS